MTPGDTSHADTCAAMTATATVITASTIATRRFLVMSCCLTWSASHCPARRRERAALRALPRGVPELS